MRRTYYPDVFVTGDESERGNNVKSGACFIVEVLSESTSDIDRGEKLRNYRRISNLQAYILVAQRQRPVEVYRPLGDGSWRHDILEEGSVELPCLNLSLGFDEIYEDVVLKSEK